LNKTSNLNFALGQKTIFFQQISPLNKTDGTFVFKIEMQIPTQNGKMKILLREHTQKMSGIPPADADFGM
jgi:hypothetical protein